jgi:hypothetical protein
MTENELIESLRRLSPNDRAGMDALVKNVVRDSRSLARAAVAHLEDPDPNVARNALSLVDYIEDLAVVPLLEAPKPPSAYGRVLRMTDIVDGQLAVREKTVVLLEKMLDDKSPVPWRTDPVVEEQPAPSRVCDEAYLLLRRLLNTREGRDERLSNARTYLHLPDARKDAEIRKAKNRVWTNLDANQ